MSNTSLNNNHLPDQVYDLNSSGFWIIPLLTLLKMCSSGLKTLLALNIKKYLKIVTNGHQHTKTTEDEKVYILNKCL